jgi:hypothetical protein
MAAPTSISVEVDRDEYSRFEVERDTILATVSVQGTSLLGEQVLVELRKARRNRDEIVVTKTVTLSTAVSHFFQVSFDLPEIIDDKAVPKVRRGEYFIRAISVTDDDVVGDSVDFRVSMISVQRLKDDYLHGTTQFSNMQLTVVEQPRLITGVTIEEISQGHQSAAFILSYNYVVDQAPSLLGVTTEPFALVDGQTLVLHINGGSPQTATFNTADFAAIGAATAAEVAAVINADIPGVIASDDGTGKVQILGDLVSGTNSILVNPTGTATTTLGLLNQGSTATVIRTLTWCGGPLVTVEPGRNMYVLQGGDRTGGVGADYIKVRVASIAQLPDQSHAEKLIVDRKPLDDDRIRAIIDQAISWVEDVALAVFLEPTRVVTEVDADDLVFPVDSDAPVLVGATWDKVVDALTYTTAGAGHWINFKCPYYPLLYFDELYGKLSNTRVIDIALEWVEAHEKTGFVELVPFNQEVAFNFIGLVWVESLRGPVPLPNFWNFNAMVGFRDTPPVILELVAKKAAIDLLTIAGQAFRGGISSQTISRDGVSESVSYTANAMYGIYTATIEDYRKWIDANLRDMRGAFRGPNMIVV